MEFIRNCNFVNNENEFLNLIILLESNVLVKSLFRYVKGNIEVKNEHLVNKHIANYPNIRFHLYRKELINLDIDLKNITYSIRLSRTTSEELKILQKLKQCEIKLNLLGLDISDVSMLGGVYDLNLSGTTVTDVSALGQVRILNLSGTNVSNVLCLSSVHNLNLHSTKVTDISALNNVNTLNISNTFVNDLILKFKYGDDRILRRKFTYGHSNIYKMYKNNRATIKNIPNLIYKK
jgi:hypothetical protein